MKKQTIFDEKTGRKILKFYMDGCDCVAPYMYFQAFSADERYVIFSSNKTGNFELYRMEIESLETTQITENFGKCYNYTCFDQYIIWNDGKRIVCADIENLDRTVLLEKENQWTEITAGPAISERGNWVSGLYKNEDGRTGIVYKKLSGNQQISGTYPLPQECKKISHLLAAPSEKLIVTFNILPDMQNNFSLPPDKRARAWKLDVENETLEPFLVMPAGFRATHEYWGHGTNNRLYFHKKTVPSWVPTFISSIDINGSDYKEHFFSEKRLLGHSAISMDNKLIVSDVQQQKENELYIINIETGKSQILCWPDSSCNPERNQLGHVHPSFSPKGTYVIFTSDRDGKSSLFIVPL